MMYCENCGQCRFIGDEPFYEKRYTSGWESNTVDNETTEFIDYVDSETSDSEHANYECPHCEGETINDSWNGTNEDAV